MRRVMLFAGAILLLAVPVIWWYRAVEPYAPELQAQTARITIAFSTVAAFIINIVGVAVWVGIAPRAGDYFLKTLSEIYQAAHWRKVKARSEAKLALSAEAGPVLTDEERQNWRARQSVLELLRAAMDVSGPEGAVIPSWRQLDGWSSKTWQEAVEYIRPHVITRTGGAGGGSTQLGAGYSSLRVFYRMVERGAVRLAQARDEIPLPDAHPTDETA